MGRRHDLDWLRVFLFALSAISHCSRLCGLGRRYP